jgi:transcriptional regulator with XRE-family HTH domain
MNKNNLASVLGQRLGRNVSRIRKLTAWTQEELAQRIGVEPETVSRVERGATVPSLSTLEKIAEVFGTTLTEVLEEPHPNVDNEARLIQAWIAPLSDQDKLFVLNIMKKLCRHCLKK